MRLRDVSRSRRGLSRKPTLAALATTVVVAVVVPLGCAVTVVVAGVGRARRGCRRRRGVGGGGAVDDLVELAAVEPHAAALWAEVDLHPFARRHRQRRVVDRALHPPEGTGAITGVGSRAGRCRMRVTQAAATRQHAPETMNAGRYEPVTSRSWPAPHAADRGAHLVAGEHPAVHERATRRAELLDADGDRRGHGRHPVEAVEHHERRAARRRACRAPGRSPAG